MFKKQADQVYLHYGYLMLSKHLQLRSREEQLFLINALWILALSDNLANPEDDLIKIIQLKQTLNAILTKVKKTVVANQHDNFFIEQLIMFWTTSNNLNMFNIFVNNLSGYIEPTQPIESSFKDAPVDTKKVNNSSISEL